MATSDTFPANPGTGLSWAHGPEEPGDCAPRVVRTFRGLVARVLVISPSSVVRVALVQRLSDLRRPRLRVTLAEDLAEGLTEAYDVMVIGPYLSTAERERAIGLHAARPGAGLVEIADLAGDAAVRVHRSGSGGVAELTEAVSAAVAPRYLSHVPTGGRDA